MLKKLVPNLLKNGHVNDELMVARDAVVNFYIMKFDSGLICIDTGWRSSSAIKAFKQLGLEISDVKALFLTHLHWDHSRCVEMFPKAKVFIGEKANDSIIRKRVKSGQTVRKVRDNEIIEEFGCKIRVAETPGHSKGSVAYMIDDTYLFTGDTIALEDGKVIPYRFLFNQDEEKQKHSIRRLAGLKDVKYLLTSHNGFTRDVDEAFAEWRIIDESTERGGGL